LITENLSTLKIHKLTKAQYDRELAAGNIDANALYLTPDDGGLPAVTTADNGKVLMVVDGAWKLGGEEVDLSGYALKSELPSKVSQLQNDSGYITGYTETDPTVPAWAKAASKPTYTASEVGADASGTASAAVIAHNTATDAHADIRDSLLTIEQGKMDATNPVCTGSFSMNRYKGTVVGAYSHTSGYNNTASGQNSHAEGYYTMASGQNSHAEGYTTMALGKISHAEGDHTTAQRKSQHVQGEYNILDTEGTTTTRGKYVHIVGNGTSAAERSNAHTLDWDGNAWYQGDVYVGSTSGMNMDEGSKKLATEEYVDGNISTKLSEINSQITSALAEALQDAKSSAEEWTFTLEDDTVVTKKVVLA
jgi:hypothetical protein